MKNFKEKCGSFLNKEVSPFLFAEIFDSVYSLIICHRDCCHFIFKLITSVSVDLYV